MQQYAPVLGRHLLRNIAQQHAQELALHSTNAVHTILTDAVNLGVEAGTRNQFQRRGQLDGCPLEGRTSSNTLHCKVSTVLGL